MINKITLSGKLKDRVSGKSEITFKSGLNFIVGKNGSGKTTLLEIMSSDPRFKGNSEFTIDQDPGTKVFHYSSEKQGVKNVSNFDDELDLGFQVNVMFTSRGQAQTAYLVNWMKRSKDQRGTNTTMLLDEPEQSMDFNAILTLATIFKGFPTDRQFICVVHSPVFFMESGLNANWIELTEDYVENQRSHFIRAALSLS